MVSLRIVGLAHIYEERLVFRALNFEFDGSCMSIVGSNGSGKSTLTRIIAGLLTPVSGKVEISIDGFPVCRDALRDDVGMVAPDVRLYGELTTRENLEFLAKARPDRIGCGRIRETLDLVGLTDRGDDLVRELSSGLRQRACFAAALLHRPSLLLLDEPSTNLDEAGVDMVHRVIALQQERGMVIIATNDQAEAALGQAKLSLGGGN